VGAHHLPHPLDINAPRTDLQIQNFRRLAGRDPLNTTEAVAFSIPTAGAACPFGIPLQCFTLATPTGATPYPNAGQTFAIIVPGMITAPITNLGSRVVNAAVANFFWPRRFPAASSAQRSSMERSPVHYALQERFHRLDQSTHRRQMVIQPTTR